MRRQQSNNANKNGNNRNGLPTGSSMSPIRGGFNMNTQINMMVGNGLLNVDPIETKMICPSSTQGINPNQSEEVYGQNKADLLYMQ